MQSKPGFLGVLFALALGSVPLRAASSELVEPANIRQGNVYIGSSLSMDQVLGSSTTSASTFDTSLALQYFVVDRLGLGGIFSYDHSSNTRDVSLLGPALHYYFWEEGHLASYVGASYTFGLTDATIAGRFTGTLGANYFITPAVAAGPWVSFRHVVGRHGPDYDRILFGASFGIYL